MRVALMEMTDDGRAPVRLGGRPIAWHQLQAALALGCERIVCLADAPGPSLAALQREAEARDVRFSAISHSRAVSGLVSSADTLFVFSPGILPDKEWLTQTLGARAGIACLPADDAVERGFERIDRDRAWGGVLATRGDAVEALALLPPDADPIAGLLRVALQRGGRCVEIPEHWLDEGRWALLGDSAAAGRVEAGWQERHVPPPGLDNPGMSLAHLIARLVLPRIADRPAAAPAIAYGGAMLAILGGGLGYLGMTVGGLATLTVGALATEVGQRLVRFIRAGAGDVPRKRLADVRDGILDLSLVAVSASPQEYSGWQGPFIALVLIAAIRLASDASAPRPVRPFGDRVPVLALLVVAAAAGGFIPAMAAIALVALALRIFWPQLRS